MTINHGTYRARSIKYGELVRGFDRMATADEMRLCADHERAEYRNAEPGTSKRARAIASAAYCDSLAERKARGRE